MSYRASHCSPDQAAEGGEGGSRVFGGGYQDSVLVELGEKRVVLERHGIKHSLIRPCHAWTNGRIERIFATFKQTVFRHGGLWLFKSLAEVDRFCGDFLVFYNRDRPHEAFAGRTPDEVYYGRRKVQRALGRVSYFDGRLHWYRFG